MGQRSSRKQNPQIRNAADSRRATNPSVDPNLTFPKRNRPPSDVGVIAAGPDEVVGFVPECVGDVLGIGGGHLPPPWTPRQVPRRNRVRSEPPPHPEPRRIPWNTQPPPPPPPPPPSRFGYEIQDLDGFLSQASLQNPANIPVVLASSCTLYQTQKRSYKSGRYRGCDVEREYLHKSNLDLKCNYEKAEQVFLPLGMVVNAVFKNKGWLYVQTPHGEEGYVSARACLPLGILPPPAPRTSPDIPFLRKDPFWGHPFTSPPNKTDNEKLRDTVSEGGGMRLKNQRRRRGVCRGSHHIRPEEAAVDRLYLKATAASSVASTSGCRNRGRWGYGDQRETLLLIRSDYHSTGCDTISVDKGDVVALVNHPLENWFWVRAHDGTEGLIPSAVAGYGYL